MYSQVYNVLWFIFMTQASCEIVILIMSALILFYFLISYSVVVCASFLSSFTLSIHGFTISSLYLFYILLLFISLASLWLLFAFSALLPSIALSCPYLIYFRFSNYIIYTRWLAKKHIVFLESPCIDHCTANGGLI